MAYTDDVCNALKSWLDETEEEAERYGCDQAWSLYAHLSAAAFERLYDRETTPHRIPTSEFKRILKERRPDSCMFDRKEMKYYHQTMQHITVEGFYLVEAYNGTHDCYRVESSQRDPYEEERQTKVYYYDRETLLPVFPKEA